MSRKDLPLMSPLVRSAQNGSISDVFFTRRNVLTRQSNVDNDVPEREGPEPESEDDIENMAKFSALGTSEINTRKRRLQSHSTFEPKECRSRVNGTTPQKMTTTNDVLK